MYKALVDFTIGCGLKRKYVVGNSYKELTEKLNTILASKVIIVEKIKYFYPSGKTFTKVF